MQSGCSRNWRTDNQGGLLSQFSGAHEPLRLFSGPVNNICVSRMGIRAGNNTKTVLDNVLRYEVSTSKYGFGFTVSGCHIFVSNFPNRRFRTLVCSVNGACPACVRWHKRLWTDSVLFRFDIFFCQDKSTKTLKRIYKRGNRVRLWGNTIQEFSQSFEVIQHQVAPVHIVYGRDQKYRRRQAISGLS